MSADTKVGQASYDKNFVQFTPLEVELGLRDVIRRDRLNWQDSFETYYLAKRAVDMPLPTGAIEEPSRLVDALVYLSERWPSRDDAFIATSRMRKDLFSWIEQSGFDFMNNTLGRYDVETTLWLARLRLTFGEERTPQVWGNMWEESDPQTVGRWTVGLIGLGRTYSVGAVTAKRAEILRRAATTEWDPAYALDVVGQFTAAEGWIKDIRSIKEEAEALK